jgi:hypothetical protein
MSELHFDADGEPTEVPADAEELRVRRFRKPGERGACEVVHGADGAPLYVSVDATYLEFRKLVDNVPGRYRLDPVDAGHRPCAHAVPCYVTIEATRNAAGAGDERDSLVRELLRANVEMMRANVEITKNVTDRLSTVMTATAEILRAADGAGLPRREPLPPAPAGNDQDDADDDEDEDDDESGNPLADTVAQFLQQAMPLLETYLADRMAARRKAESAAASSPAAAPAPAPQAAAPVPSAAPTNPPGPAATDSSTTPASPSPQASGAATTAPNNAPAAAGHEVRNAAPDSTPAPEQLQHLIAVKAKLTPQEQRVVMAAIPRMEPAARAHWLGELCALPVDQAAELMRSMMPPLRTEPAQPRRRKP